MSTAEKKSSVDVFEYFAYDANIEGKAEYFDGKIFDRLGGSPEHTEIVSNFHYAARKLLEGRDCGVYTQDLRLEVQSGNAYVYPDISIVCGPLERSELDRKTIRNPVIVVEVLSRLTSDFDRGMKRDYYMSIPSVQVYLLIEQNEPKVDVFTRETDGRWTFFQVTGLDATLHLSALEIPIAIPLIELYRRVSFPD
jgi:Uma2 family endonuclease